MRAENAARTLGTSTDQPTHCWPGTLGQNVPLEEGQERNTAGKQQQPRCRGAEPHPSHRTAAVRAAPGCAPSCASAV